MRRRYTNQKGFTLVELLATLAILAMLLLIATPAIGGILDKAKVSADDSSVELIEKAAEKASVGKLPFVDTAPEENSYTIPVLIDEGYLSLDEDSPFNDSANYAVKDPTPGSSKFIYKGVGGPGSDVGAGDGDGDGDGDGTTDPGTTDPGTTDPGTEEPVGPPETDPSLFTWEWLDQPNNEIRITGYTGPKGTTVDLVIPRMIEGHEVVSILKVGWSWDKFATIILPNTLRIIEPAAFEDKGLTQIHIPASVRTIGDKAFYKNPFTSITFDHGVVSIGAQAFTYGSAADLGTITFPGSLETIGTAAFDNIKIDAVEFVGSGLKQVGAKAFWRNNLTTLNLPNSVTQIGDSAFATNKITNLTLTPLALDSIGSTAFASNPFQTVTIFDRDVTFGFAAFNVTDSTITEFTIRGYAGSTTQTYAENYGSTRVTANFEPIAEQ